MRRYKFFTVVLLGLLFSTLSYAQNYTWIKYAHTSFITSEGEHKTDGGQRFAFDGNCIIKYSENEFKLETLDGMSHTNYLEYGIYIGDNSGNKMYQVYIKGKDFRGNLYNRKFDNKYFIVSPDNTVINEILTNNLGETKHIDVYKKASAPSGQLYN